MENLTKIRERISRRLNKVTERLEKLECIEDVESGFSFSTGILIDFSHNCPEYIDRVQEKIRAWVIEKYPDSRFEFDVGKGSVNFLYLCNPEETQKVYANFIGYFIEAIRKSKP